MTETSFEIASKYKPSTLTEFNNARGQALHQYIHLEAQTGTAFEFAVGAREYRSVNHKRSQIAKKAFSRMMKSHRNYYAILKDIAEMYLPEENQLFVKGLVKELGKATNIRNNIAHDETSNIVGNDGEQRFCIDTRKEDKRFLFIEDLVEYKQQLKYLFYAIFAYNGLLFSGKPEWIDEDLYTELTTSDFKISFKSDAILIKAGLFK